MVQWAKLGPACRKVTGPMVAKEIGRRTREWAGKTSLGLAEAEPAWR